MPVFQKFFYELLQVQQDLNPIKEVVKEVIGDSVNNNRTLTVNQVIRFLGGNHDKKARQLTVVLGILKPVIKVNRIISTNRSDAIDLNELVSTYRAVVMDKRKLRQEVGQAISKVG